jgi:acyl dehydratase
VETHWFEDYGPDFELTTARRTIGETEIVLFATMTGLHEAPFMSEVDAANGVFGARVSPALLTMAVADGLVVLSGLLHGAAIAFLSVGNVKTPRPVLKGDTIHARVTLVSKRLAGKGHAGVVVTRHEVLNQHDEVVMEYEMTRLIAVRPKTESEQAAAEHAAADRVR